MNDMLRSFLSAAAAAAVIGLIGGPVLAGAGDYVFEAVQQEMKKGDDVTVALRLVHKPSGKTVPDAVIVRTRIDMAPDGMATMESPVTPLPSPESGVYAFKTDLPMEGRYQFSIAAKVQGEQETITNRVIFKAVK